MGSKLVRRGVEGGGAGGEHTGWKRSMIGQVAETLEELVGW